MRTFFFLSNILNGGMRVKLTRDCSENQIEGRNPDYIIIGGSINSFNNLNTKKFQKMNV